MLTYSAERIEGLSELNEIKVKLVIALLADTIGLNIPKPRGDDNFSSPVNKPPLVADPNSGKPFGKFVRKLELGGYSYISGAIYVAVLTSYLRQK